MEHVVSKWKEGHGLRRWDPARLTHFSFCSTDSTATLFGLHPSETAHLVTPNDGPDRRVTEKLQVGSYFGGLEQMSCQRNESLDNNEAYIGHVTRAWEICLPAMITYRRLYSWFQVVMHQCLQKSLPNLLQEKRNIEKLLGFSSDSGDLKKTSPTPPKLGSSPGHRRDGALGRPAFPGEKRGFPRGFPRMPKGVWLGGGCWGCLELVGVFF